MSANPWPAWWPSASEGEPPVGGGLWAQLKAATDVSQMRPAQADGVLSKEMEDASGRHVMLKNSRTHTYARLSPEEFWIWQQLDGSRTVQQLVLTYFLKYKAFALAAILSLTSRLRMQSMLQEPPRVLYADMARTLQERTPLYRLSWLARVVFTKEWDIKGLDGYLDRIYRYGGWILFSLPVQLVLLLVAVIGTTLFVGLANDPRYPLLSGGLGVAIIRLGVLAYIPLVIHEFGHALTAKHVGCEVYRGGVMLYFGLPAAFVDTTDVWMFGKRARLAVTWAGPYTGYIIGGACTLLVYFWQGLPVGPATVLLQIALVGIVTSTYNLMPVLKLDGYYLLADALEIPALREQSLAFVAGPLRGKLQRREAWRREEWIFLIFGLLSIVSTLYFIYAAIAFWDSQTSQSLSQLWHWNSEAATQLFNIFIVLLALSLSIYAIYSVAYQGHRLINWLRQKGLFATRGRAAWVLIAGASLVAWLPSLLLPTLAGWLTWGADFVIFAIATWLAIKTWSEMRGSVHAGLWLMAAVGLGLGFVSAGVRLADNSGWLSTGLGVAGLGCTLLALVVGGQLVLGLAGSWRAGSLGVYVLGLGVWGLALVAQAFLPVNPIHLLAGLLLAGSLVHWQMRPATRQAESAPPEGPGLSTTRARIVHVFNTIKTTILQEVEADFGHQTRERVENGSYRHRKVWGGQQKGSRSGETLSSTQTGMTPNDYGGALAIMLEDLLTDVEKAGGLTYARRSLAIGFDSLGWELQELAEDYLLQYIPQAASLSGQLASGRGLQTEIQTLLRSTPLFTTMADQEIKILSQHFKPLRFERHEDIVRQGEAGTAFYLIRLGKVRVLRHDSEGEHKLNELARGDYFGEAALLNGERRNASVQALLPTEVLALSRTDFNQLVRKNFDLADKVQATVRRLNVLRQIPLFAGFEGFELNLLANLLAPQEVPAGTAIFKQGDPADRFYIIESGKVSVQILDAETGPVAVERAILGAGEYFGEIALIMNLPRTATVVATQPTRLLSLSAESFREMVDESRGLKQALERASSRRVLANDRWIRQESRARAPGGVL